MCVSKVFLGNGSVLQRWPGQWSDISPADRITSVKSTE